MIDVTPPEALLSCESEMVGVSDVKCWIELSNDVVGMNEDCIEMNDNGIVALD